MGEVVDKPSVEVGEAKKGSYVLYVVWVFLVDYILYLLRVHLHSISADYVAKVDNFSLVELAFVDIKL